MVIAATNPNHEKDLFIDDGIADSVLDGNSETRWQKKAGLPLPVLIDLAILVGFEIPPKTSMNSKVLISFFLAALTATSLVSCASNSQPTRNRYESAANVIRKGQNQAQIRNYLGDPRSRELSPKGETWIYGGSKRTAADELVNVGVGMIPYGGGSILRGIGRAQRADAPGARITFDQSGRVTNYVFDLP
tara:strand:- start:1524 stop:2093 length:570 start_codon:yes stop_codon:yes gene_type:complete